MSMEMDGAPPSLPAPELTELGKRIEILRIERGVSKQHLARFAGASRQQLWRVMTGKSDLTSALRERLAEALGVEPRVFQQELLGDRIELVPDDGHSASADAGIPITVADYLADPRHIERTLGTLPPGEAGRRLKRALLNCIEEVAEAEEILLDGRFFELRRRVQAGEL